MYKLDTLLVQTKSHIISKEEEENKYGEITDLSPKHDQQLSFLCDSTSKPAMFTQLYSSFISLAGLM